jgi:hypothetical protein
MLASYAGANIFGIVLTMRVAQEGQFQTQKTAVAGLDGVEVMTLGQREEYTTVKGVLNGASVADVISQMATLRAAKRWGMNDLVDNFGNVWPYVILESWMQEEPIRYDGSGLYGYYVHYTARLFHPVLPGDFPDS